MPDEEIVVSESEMAATDGTDGTDETDETDVTGQTGDEDVGIGETEAIDATRLTGDAEAAATEGEAEGASAALLDVVVIDAVARAAKVESGIVAIELESAEAARVPGGVRSGRMEIDRLAACCCVGLAVCPSQFGDTRNGCACWKTIAWPKSLRVPIVARRFVVSTMFPSVSAS